MKNLNIQLQKSAKTKRGRPRKHISVEVIPEPEAFVEMKRKRGRPRKDTTASNDVNSDSFCDIDTDNLIDLDEKEYQLIKKVKSEKAKIVKTDKKKYYVDTKRLKDIILTYYDSNIITDELATALYNIANRIGFMPNFINYSWKEEMIGDGLIKEFLALKNKKFDPDKGKAFSYFSMIVYNAFCNRIKKELKEKEVLKEYQDEQYNILMPNENAQKITHDDNSDGDFE